MTLRGIPLTVDEQIQDLYAELRKRKPMSGDPPETNLLVEVDGIAIGTAQILNLLQGSGIILGGSSSDGQVNITFSSSGGTNDHDHMGTGTDSTVLTGLSDATPALAGGADSLAGGNAATAPGDGSVALGAYADSLDGGVALGANAAADGTSAIALGPSTEADGYEGIAIGHTTNAVPDYATAVGSGASILTGADHGAAVGHNSFVDSQESISIGYSASTGTGAGASLVGVASIAIGSNAQAGTANLDYGIAIGYTANGNGAKAIAIGYQATVASADYSTAIGHDAAATNSHQMMLGTGAERMFSGVPNSAVTDADIPTSMVTAYVDETLHTLKFRVRYSDGTTLKTGTVALV